MRQEQHVLSAVVLDVVQDGDADSRIGHVSLVVVHKAVAQVHRASEQRDASPKAGRVVEHRAVDQGGVGAAARHLAVV